MAPVQEITVVSAVIHDHQGRVLLSQRAKDGVRELEEELGITITVESPLTFAVHEEPGLRILLLFYRARIDSGEPHGREGQAVEWVPVTELPSYPTPPADAELVQCLADGSLS
jgi:8-oxo-dGTP diphosphatase